ncbi:hypothetical protein [Erythrobacter rubeus]|uniref:VOC domain-containing protein n=1 Tax=Erythrobacter rubeus TaxID=2760803 RepID=A0ABR8KQW2_9SPHN|nr:hypothetical protein [Erythrobacter rubeus]MBD2843156.1 hypothetical protein [Erythrobacter rubeus]
MITQKGLIASLPFAAFLAGLPVAVSAEEADVPSASAFAPMQRYAIAYPEPRDVAEFYVRDLGMKARAADFEEFDHPNDRSMRIVLVTVDGIADDTVGAVQLRLGLRFSEGSWEAVEAGMRRKCQRGANAGEWTREVCP